MLKVAILQSNYIPWKGVFDMINQVDKFVFFEDVQFTKRDWRTRNKIKSSNGEIWLSVPVKKCNRGTKIFDVEISYDINWMEKHRKVIEYNYSKSKYFDKFKYILDDIYGKKYTKLSDFNVFTTKYISELLGIKTEFYNSKDILTRNTKDDKLIDICKNLNADFYLSGPSAKNYIINEKFEKNCIKLAYIKYEYPEYNQMYGKFNHFVSILDVLFNCGYDTPKYIFMNKYEEIL